jgi:hypothetical protein
LDDEVNGLPARSLEFADGAAVHMETYSDYAAVTWSTAQSAADFLRVADRYLGFGQDDLGLIVDGEGQVRENMRVAEMYQSLGDDRLTVARVDLVGRGIAAVWEWPRAFGAPFAEVGIGAEAGTLEREVLQALLDETCAPSLREVTSEVLHAVTMVAGQVWGWALGSEGVGV